MSSTTIAPAPAPNRTVMVGVGAFLAGAVAVGAVAYVAARVTPAPTTSATVSVPFSSDDAAALTATRAGDSRDVAAAKRHASRVVTPQPVASRSVIPPQRYEWTLTSS